MDRRHFLSLSGTAALVAALPSPLWAAPQAADRRLSLLNTHTGESLDAVYRTGDGYVPETLAAVDRLLRDHRTGDVHAIDPALLDQLHDLAHRLESDPIFEVISGFRSARTNARLRGTARRSLHMEGRAVDVRLPGVPHRSLHRAALALRAGGVGDYPDSDFIHLDTGDVRRW